MSGSLIGGVVGSVIGFTFGNPQIGWLVGSMVGGMVFPEERDGPQLADLRPQASEYGRPIPIIYGTMAVGGNVIWASDLVKTSDGDGGGGKGGGGGGGSGPTYAANFAVLICESSGDKKLGRIWAGPDKRLIYDGATLESGTLRYYDGREDQMPDPLEESYLGAGSVPAYRGYARVVIEGFDVSAHDGNRIPFLTIEIGHLNAVTLGYVQPKRAWVDGGDVVLWKGPGRGGLLVANTTTHAMQSNIEFDVDSATDDSSDVLYDSTRDVFVNYKRTGTNGIYSTSTAPGSTPIAHTLDTTGKPADLSVFAGDCLYFGGKYLFSVRKTSASNEFGLYVVDPATWSTEAIRRYPGMDIGQSWLAAPFAGADWVYALSAAKVWKLPLDGSAPILLGDMPASATTSRPVFGIDEVTGWLYTTPNVTTHTTTLTYAIYDGSSETKLIQDTVACSAGFRPKCFASVPRTTTSLLPPAMYLCGGTTVYQDGFIKWDSLASSPLCFGFYLSVAGGTPTINGGGEIEAAVYDPGRDVLMVFRDAYSYGIVAETVAGGYPEAAPGIPFSTWHIGESSLTPQPVPLSEVVTDLSIRAGLTPEQIDVSELTDMVDGYTLANQVTVKDAIAALMPAYYFDAAEDQGKLRFIKRGGSIVAEIPEDDLGAHGSDEDASDLYQKTRGMDDELPRTFSVNYILAATKYSPATKYARRLIGYSGNEARLDMPMVFSDEKAMQVAQVNLHEQWVGRITYKLSLGRKYAYLMPTDLVGIPGPNGEGYTVRLTKVTQKDNGVLEFDAVSDDSDVYTPHVIVQETPPPDESPNVPVPTVLELM